VDLLQQLWPYIEAGDETPKVELKRSSWELGTARGKAEFAKDVSALANTSGGDGYLIVGVLDKKERQEQSPGESPDCLCGVPECSEDEIGALERQMNQALETYCDPPPSVGYQQLRHEPSGEWIGVVIIPQSSRRPHVIIRGGEGIQPQDIWVRRGEHDAACFKANRTELEEMFAGKGYMVTSSVDSTSKVRARPIALTIGLGGSVQGAVMKWLYDNGLRMPVYDYSMEGFIPEEQFGDVIKKFNAIKAELTQQGVTEVHLFYKGPVTLAMALGSILSNWVPLKVYAFSGGSYSLQVTFDKRTVRGL
jgi:hypothetical protein